MGTLNDFLGSYELVVMWTLAGVLFLGFLGGIVKVINGWRLWYKRNQL